MSKAALKFDSESKPVKMVGSHQDITELKNTEKRLIESQRLLKETGAIARVGGWELYTDTRNVTWSEEVYKIHEYESNEPPALEEAINFFDPADRPILAKAIEEAFEKGKSYDLELRLITSKNNKIWVHTSCKPEVKNGKTIRLKGTIQDITERKSLEREFKKSEKKYKNLFNSIRDAILVADKERNIISCNKAFTDLFGYNEEELLGKKTSFVYNDKAQFSDLGVRINYNNNEFFYTIDYIKKSGEVFPGETGVYFFNDENGKRIGFIGVIRDISEKKVSQEKIAQSESRFKSLVENLFDAVIVIDDQGIIRFANKAAGLLFERSKSELIGKDFGYPISGDQTSLIEIYTRENKLKYVEIKKTYVNWNDQVSSLLSIRDITASQQAEIERRQIQDHIKQFQKFEAIAALAGGIAHDFNNLLAPIMGYAELEISRTEINSKLYESLNQILSASNRAKDLVKQILAFSRKDDAKFTNVKIASIVKEVMKLLKSAFPSTIKQEMNLNSESMIYGNPTQIHQVIMNLCTNAKHSMEDNGGVLTLSVDDIIVDKKFIRHYPTLKTGEYVKVTISDTGKGIDKKIINKIFDPYFTTKEKDKGTGIGLSVVQGIVQNHGGLITVKSFPDKGSSFTVFLPKIENTQKTILLSDEAITEGKTSVRILVLDDEKPVLKINTKLIEQLGYTVDPYLSSEKALEAFKSDPYKYDLIITDMTMPKITGDVFAEKIYEIRNDIPIILISGLPGNHKIKTSSDGGFVDDILVKPVSKKKLSESISKAMNKA